MKIRGKVSRGVVILDDGNVLPDGTVVRVEPLAEPDSARGQSPSLAEKLCRLAGKAQGLPADLARNHDHYLHGLTKR